MLSCAGRFLSGRLSQPHRNSRGICGILKSENTSFKGNVPIRNIKEAHSSCLNKTNIKARLVVLKLKHEVEHILREICFCTKRKNKTGFHYVRLSNRIFGIRDIFYMLCCPGQLSRMSI